MGKLFDFNTFLATASNTTISSTLMIRKVVTGNRSQSNMLLFKWSRVSHFLDKDAQPPLKSWFILVYRV